MAKQLISDYSLSTEHLTEEQLRKALSGNIEGFRYFFNNCCQLQDKETRQMIHPTLNKGQELIAKTLLKYISKETRTDYHRECVILGPRQFGKSTLITAISNYMMAYVPGCERINLVHTLQTGATAGKYYSQKIAPIVTGIHPDLFATIEKNTLGTSTMLTYKDTKGIPRNGIYEITSAGSNSVRSGTVTVWLADEPSEYRAPEAVEDAISGAISDYGFSFTAYIGTFSDRITPYFLNKINTAINNPDEMDFVFIPWFLVYGREGDGQGVDMDNLSEYEEKTIVPEMIKNNIPNDEWADKIGWYRRRSLRTSNIRYEFPTSVEDILALTSDITVFPREQVEKQRSEAVQGFKRRFVVDTYTRKPEAQLTDEPSPFVMYKEPIYGRNYKITVDPITAVSEESDWFAMSVFDAQTNEQVATFRGRDMPIEDYADYAVNIATIYNKAMIIPEINVAGAFVACVNNLRYYNWYYLTPKHRKDRIPGIRTSVSTKNDMIQKLQMMLAQGTIKVNDPIWLDELNDFVKKTTKSGNIKMEARKGKHDDTVATLFLYAGSLTDREIQGQKRSGFAIL